MRESVAICSAIGPQLVPGQEPDLRSQPLVEELLELERAGALLRVLRVEGRSGQRSSSAAMIAVESPMLRPSSRRTGKVFWAPR